MTINNLESRRPINTYAIAQTTLDACIKQLANTQIGDSDWIAATQTLGQMDPIFARLQLDAIADDRYQVCRALTVSLSKMGPEVFDKVVYTLKHRHPNVRQIACGLIYGLYQRGRVQIESAVAPLAEALLDSDCRVRHKAAVTLSFIGANAVKAIPNLIRALSDEDDFVREWAAHALATMGPCAQSAVSVLEAAICDEEPAVRQAALESLQAIQVHRGNPQL